MTEQLKAEAYVRSQRPALLELTRGCILMKRRWGKNVYGELLEKTSGNFESGGPILGVVFWFNGRRTALKELVPALTIIGHPIQLPDWLAVLEKTGDWDCRCKIEDGVMKLFASEPIISFNLTTGQPNSPEDYLAFNNITRV